MYRLFNKNVLICLASVLISLVAGELVCRRYLQERSDTFVKKISDVRSKYHHPLKLKEALEAPDPGAYRILFLGDSMTYGFCEAGSSYPHLIKEYFLTPGLGQGRFKVQTFNLGTASYSPSVYGVLLRDYVPVLKPHMVVIAVDDSDPQDDLFYGPSLEKDETGLPISVYPHLAGVPRFLQPLGREFAIIRFPCGLIDRMLPHRKKILTISTWENRLNHYNAGSLPRWEEAFARTLSLVDATVNYCRERNIKVALITYPYAPAVTTQYCVNWRKQFNLGTGALYFPLYFHIAQARYASSAGVPYYDFTDYLINLPDHRGIYNEEDGHFTSKGNALLARQLVVFLAPRIDAEYKLNE